MAELLGTSDPALPGRLITDTLQADHIVSMSRIVSMEGFDKLTESQKLEVLNNPHNFFGLSETANKSKGAKTYMQWKKYKAGNIDVDSNFRHSMIIEEAVLERVIQGQIDNFLTGGIN